MTKPAARVATRADFMALLPITTRWMDNDAYGHVNNVVYYSWFDTAINRLLITGGLLDLASSTVVSVVAETGCRYRAQISYPDDVTIGVRVAHLGRSSVRYELGVFRADDETASAEGHLVHVAVDRASMRPVPLPDALRAHLQALQPAAGPAG